MGIPLIDLDMPDSTNMAAEAQLDLNQVAAALLNALDARSKDVVVRRYGLRSAKPETLESIGREYGITRERVRQIQSQAKKVLRDKDDELAPVAAVFESVFQKYGGIMTSSHVFEAVSEHLGCEQESHVVLFYLDVLDPYQSVTRHKLFATHWRHPKHQNHHSEVLMQVAENILKVTKHPMLEDQFLVAIEQQLPEPVRMEIPQPHLLAHLRASKKIQVTPFREWGLARWAETNPRGVGDKAYAVLRRHGAPEHFTRITDLINEARFDHKVANPQTVHNELIKDSRFVLVGRGLYGLKEWGFIPGTVADVIATLLKEARKPLSRDEIIEKVLEQRQVKKNTILLGLQNSNRFIRTDENRFTINQDR